MAMIKETLLIVKISELVKNNDSGKASDYSELTETIEQVVSEMIGNEKAIVEVILDDSEQ